MGPVHLRRQRPAASKPKSAATAAITQAPAFLVVWEIPAAAITIAATTYAITAVSAHHAFGVEHGISSPHVWLLRHYCRLAADVLRGCDYTATR